MKARKFNYIKGDVSTDIPWFRPDPVQLNAWKDEVFKNIDLENYDIWALGSALQGIKTWDLDINVVGKINNPDSLKNILDGLVSIGFKHRQLIDISWLNTDPDRFQSLQDLNSPDFLTAQYPLDIVRSFEIVVKNGRISRPFDGRIEGDSVHPGLWRYTLEECVPKIAEKFHKGLHPVAPVKITADIDFREYISWP